MHLAAPLLVALTAGAAAPAQAAIPFSPCRTAGCGGAHRAVPLDRAGAVPGTVALAVVRARATANPTNSAVVAIAGGPGQAATPLAEDFAGALGPSLPNRDLLIFDQRGTGRSSPLA